MAIDPQNTDTVAIPQLPDLVLALEIFLVGANADGKMGKFTAQQLADFIAPYISALGSSPFVANTGSPLPNPIDKPTAITFVGIGDFDQTTGANVVTTEELNVLFWASNGVTGTWVLGVAVPIDLSAYKTNTQAEIDYVNILSLKYGDIYPADRSAVTFSTGNLNTAVFYYEDEHLFLAGEKIKQLFIKSNANGNARIGFITVAAGVSTVLYSTTYPVSTGVNNVNISMLNIPDSVYDQDYYICGSSVESGTLKYNSQVGANGHLTTNLSGGAVSNATAIFPFWFTKKYVLDEYPETKELTEKVANMTGDATTQILPEDRSALVFNANSASTLWFGNDSCWFGSSKPFKSLTLKAKSAANDIKIAFYEINGTTATLIYESQLIDIVAVANQTILLSDLVGVPGNINTAYPRLQVFVANETYVSPAAFGYKTVTAGLGDKYYTIAKATGVLTTQQSSSSVAQLGYWITVDTVIYPPIVQAVRDMQVLSTSVSNYNQFVDALANGDEVRISGGNNEIAFTVNVPANKKIYGTRGAVLKSPVGGTNILYLNEAFGTIIEGITLDGGASQIDIGGGTILPAGIDLETLTGNGTNKGIIIYRGDGVKIRDVKVKNFSSFGIELLSTGDNGASDVTGYRFKEGAVFEGVTGENNYISFRIGEGGQYSRYTDCKSIQSICGISVCGGNITVNNGQFDNNRVNAHVGAGSNNAHGSFVGGTMNHAKLRGLVVANITNGHVFTGVNMFDGHIEVYNSIGVVISGGLIASEITALLNANQAMQIVGCIWRSDGGYNTGTINKTGSGKLFLDLNRFTTGKADTTINGIL